MIPYCSRCSGSRVAIRAGIDQNEKIRFGGKNGRYSRTIDARQRAQFDRRRGDGGASVTRADDRRRFCLFSPGRQRG